MDDVESQPMYPRLVRRVRAVLFDSVVFMLVLFAWMVGLPALEGFDFSVKIAIPALAFMVLEPGLVAFTGGTLGHHVMGLRIRDASRNRNIGFLRATVREILRTLFGWLSFIFVFVTRQHQALHDYITGTVVVLRRPDAVAAYDRLPARAEKDAASYAYPSKARRIIVVLLYVVLGTVALAYVLASTVSDDCAETGHCTRRETTITGFLEIVWILGAGVIVVSGWRGRLPGCRRVPMPPASVDSSDVI
jgi:uncharacterized RDD family membrane protein YckC